MVSQQNVLELAQQGDAQAIAILMNQALEAKGIRARVVRKQNCLHVLLEAEQTPAAQLAPSICEGVVQLNPKAMQSLHIYGRSEGAQTPEWHRSWVFPQVTDQDLRPVDQQSIPHAAGTVTLPSFPAQTTPAQTTTKPVAPPPNFAPSIQPIAASIESPPDRKTNRPDSLAIDPLDLSALDLELQNLELQNLELQDQDNPAPTRPRPVTSPSTRSGSARSRSGRSGSARSNSVPSSPRRRGPATPSSPTSTPVQPTNRRNRLVVPLAFSAGVVVGAGWNQIIKPLTGLLATNASNAPAANDVTVLNTEAALTPDPAASEVVVLDDQPATPATQETIVIKAVGDIIPGTNFPGDRLPAQDGQWLFDNVKSQFDGADILFGNFESTLTDHPYAAKDTSLGQTFAFRTPPAYATLLQQLGFDVLSVANNHSFDFGDQGFNDTVDHIQKAGMQAVGRKGEIIYQKVKGATIAFIGFSYFPDHNSILDLDAARALVDEANRNANIVVISVHAGAEGTDAVHTRNETEFFFGENRGNLVEFSRAMIDQGADLILGHGPHVPRALELYKSRLIAYSLGNFMGYRTLSTEGILSYSLILQVQLDAQGGFVDGKIIPVRLDAQGVPYIDDSFQSVGLIRNLIESDFPVTPLLINNDGQVVKNEAPLPTGG